MSEPLSAEIRRRLDKAIFAGRLFGAAARVAARLAVTAGATRDDGLLAAALLIADAARARPAAERMIYAEAAASAVCGIAAELLAKLERADARPRCFVETKQLSGG